jgi:hypothetical protein
VLASQAQPQPHAENEAGNPADRAREEGREHRAAAFEIGHPHRARYGIGDCSAGGISAGSAQHTTEECEDKGHDVLPTQNACGEKTISDLNLTVRGVFSYSRPPQSSG